MKNKQGKTMLIDPPMTTDCFTNIRIIDWKCVLNEFL
jgi:hypothetical protein